MGYWERIIRLFSSCSTPYQADLLCVSPTFVQLHFVPLFIYMCLSYILLFKDISCSVSSSSILELNVCWDATRLANANFLFIWLQVFSLTSFLSYSITDCFAYKASIYQCAHRFAWLQVCVYMAAGQILSLCPFQGYVIFFC